MSCTSSSTSPAIDVAPATSTVHLQFNAGEDVDIDLVTADADGDGVLLAGAVATIAPAGGTVVHTWSVGAGNLALLVDPDDPTHFTGVRLSTTAEETASWWEAWGEAGWQLDVTDLFGQSKRACEGGVQVRAPRRTCLT
jgi:hypothetical protein